MRSFRTSRIALLGIILAGSVYGSTDPPTRITRNVGENFEAAVLTFLDEVEQCYITNPSMKNIVFKPKDESDDKYELLENTDFVRCRVRVGDLDVNDVGVWTLYAVNDRGITQSQSYNVTVNSPSEPDSSKEDTEGTTTPEVKIDNLDELRFDTRLGATHRVEIPYRDFFQTEDCYIATPDQTRVNLENHGISGIEIIRDPNVACGVVLNLAEKEQIGQWFLISREIRYSSDLYERRLPFTIAVTEEVNAIPNEISVDQNKDFYVRLETGVANPESCKLLRPNGVEHTNYETDPRYVDTCGFIVRNANEMDNGRWQIVYGNRITYNAPFQVTIHTNGVQEEDQHRVFTWTRDQPVQEIIGSDDTIYCKVMDPKSFVVFEGFGRCNITLPRATSDHEGNWKMFVGLRGRVLTEESVLSVQIIDESPKAVVTTNITTNKPVVTLSCSVSSPYPIRACKFRNPSGHILMANPGVGEDRYTFHGQESSYESGVHTHDCGIQITNPLIRDLGLWRCAIETSDETYYGFLTAWCPWATRDPEVAAGILRDPILTADRPQLTTVEGDSVLMSCSVESAIRYCYFRTSNGTIYNVGPEYSSTDMAEYAGVGLDGGECSIRFRSLSVADSGRWSCHVGFHDLRMPEQRDNFNVRVKDIMVVTQTDTTVKAVVEGRQLDYCRFVRIDGFGFTSDAVPAQYFVKSFLHIGECTLWTFDPSILDRHPWTVITKISGQNQEISRTTNGTLVLPGPVEIVHYRLHTLWIVFLASGLILIVLSALIAPKKNRDWTYGKVANLRSSFRQQFVKKAAADANVSERNTANVA